jgi:ThiF family/Prokaryotic E2 family A/Prokaryotic homologs of the JAB domain
VASQTPGQHQARDELEEIQSLTGQPPAMRVENIGEAEDRWLPIGISLDCSTVATAPGIEPLAQREYVTLHVPAAFPFSRPTAEVAHSRFAGRPYVLHGHQICLYHSDSDWNPAHGMFGFVGRLVAWYRRAAAGRLVEPGQPLHPPLAYPRFADADCVVIRPDLPGDFEPAAAVMVREYPWRADVVSWLRPSALEVSRPALERLMSELTNVARSHERPAFLAAVRILHQPLSFEFPDNFPALLDALSAEHVHSKELLEHLARVWLTNLVAAVRPEGPAPLHVIVGAPMRGFAGAENPDMHLAVWQLDAAEAAVPQIITGAGGGALQPLSWMPADQDRAMEWLYHAPLSWTWVQESRRQIVTRRDTGKPAQWLLGKSVIVLGCGALGARIAEHCVRAGSSRLTLVDNGAVGAGILVRQPYADADVGRPKAMRLAERLALIRQPPGLKIEAEAADVLHTILGDDAALPSADLIVDATANRGVSARIEWLRRKRPARWPPVLTVGVGHACERAVGALALPHATGAGADILHSLADRAVQDASLRDVAEDFFAEPDAVHVFQPEIGCSEPTFTGSDPEAAAAAGQVFTWALRVLSDHAARRPVTAKSLFLARLPGDPDRPAHEYRSWPNDMLADDEQSGYQLRIRPKALEDMRAEAQTTACLFSPRSETGGLLLGYADDACRVIWVTDAEGPPADSVRGQHFLRLGTAGVIGRVAEYQRNSRGRVRFVGMWHTHPGMSADASGVDAAAMSDLLGHATTAQAPRRAVRLIVGGSRDQWGYWLRGIGRPEIRFQLFTRKQAGPPESVTEPAEQER